MTTKTPTNIHLSGNEHGHVALCCEYQGARYHVWVDRHEYRPVDSVLFKNPPLRVEYRGEGYFNTRMLDMNGAIGRKIVPLMQAAIPTIAPAFEKHIAYEVEQRAIAAEQLKQAARIKEAAPVLLAALEAMVKTFGNSTVLSDYGRGVVAQANATINQAKGL
jgi:hypothetical protein